MVFDKTDKWCGFGAHKCGPQCALWCNGLKGCVLHSMNLHLAQLAKVEKGGEKGAVQAEKKEAVSA